MVKLVLLHVVLLKATVSKNLSTMLSEDLLCFFFPPSTGRSQQIHFSWIFPVKLRTRKIKGDQTLNKVNLLTGYSSVKECSE